MANEQTVWTAGCALILDRFCLYADLEEDKDAYAFMARWATAEIGRNLRPGVSIPDNEERLVNLGAAMCYYRHALTRHTGRMQVGQVSVDGGVSMEVARQLLDECTGECAGLLQDSGFLFKQVGI